MNKNSKFLNYKSYEFYGATMLDTLGVTRQSIHKLTIEYEIKALIK